MDRVEVIARAMHRRFEQNAQRRTQNGYSPQRWENIGERYQAEFLDYARAVDAALDDHERP